MGDLTRNTFTGGLDYNASINSVNPSKLTESRNVLFSDVFDKHKFTALENVKGTTQLRQLDSGDGRALAIFINNYTIDTATNVRCATIFSVYDDVFKIQAYDIVNDVLYDLYSQAVPGDYNGPERAIDGIGYGEFGNDVLYFTDNYHQVRKLTCVIPPAYIANFLVDSDIELASKAAIGTITLDNIITGGSLLTGTYQLAYQLINPDTNKQTRFSLLTTPIHVYTTIDSVIRAGIGLPSDRKIVIDIMPTAEELAAYTHFRIAVVENINPSGLSDNEVGVTPIAAITDYLTAGVLQNYTITSNTQYNSVLLDELVIDLAAIEKVATLTIKDSRLLFGNVTLKEFEYDNGQPIVSSGQILTQSTSGDSFSSDVFASRYKGHFREEVYRYVISYFDDFGNYSPPVVLNLNGVTDNAIVGAPDMKFPARNNSNAGYHIMSTGNATQSLGLRLTNIINHPTWSRGFIIARAKRNKRVLFQSPFIPMTLFAGIGAVGDYPTTAQESGGAVNYPNAAPMGPSTVFMPQNLFFGAYTGANGIWSGGTLGAGSNTLVDGENMGLFYQSIYTHGMLFPPQNMYENNAYSFAGNEQISTVDAAITRLYMSRFDSDLNLPAESINNSVSGTFFASLNNDYYWNAGAGVKPVLRNIDDDLPIVGNAAFDNFGEGSVVGGTMVWDKTKLETGGIPMGVPMETQRSVVVAMSKSREVIGGPSGLPGLTFASGVPVYASHTFGFLNNNTYPFTSSGLAASYINAIEIVNITTNKTDTRYGGQSDFNEYIFTGTKVVFSPSELLDVQASVAVPKTVDIWGGDCVVSPHTFKIADTAYAMINQQKADVVGGLSSNTLVQHFGRTWLNSGGAGIIMPVPIKNASQYLTVVLESEYHGSVRDVDSYEVLGTYNFQIMGAKSETKTRAPLSYAYNINLNKQNDQKIFVPKDPLDILPNSLPSRIYYTDLKIYQSTIQGFDKIRVLNYLDLPERFGAITKLALNGDSLIAVQENAINYVPVGEKVLEQTDASEIAVRSGDFLSIPLTIDSIRGAQQLGAVLEVGNELFIFDSRRKDLYKLSGRELRSITSDTMSSYFVPTYTATPANGDVKMWYDYNRNHLWLSNQSASETYVYNNRLGIWETGFQFRPEGGISSELVPDLLLVGNRNIHSMYTGPRTLLFDQYVTPSISFVINAQPDFSKVFDSFVVVSTNPVSLVLSARYPGSPFASQQTNIMPATSHRGEGNYKVKVVRDIAVNPGARMRGTAGTVVVIWPSAVDAPQTLLESVVTQYRISQKVV